MEIKTRPLNHGEIFPCTFKRAKELFKNSSVVLNFAYTSRSYGTFKNTQDAYYLKNNIQGIIISSMYMFPRQEKPLLSLYVLKKSIFSAKLQEKFENEFLPAYYEFYQSLSDEKSMIDTTHLLLVELRDGHLQSHHIQLH